MWKGCLVCPLPTEQAFEDKLQNRMTVTTNSGESRAYVISRATLLPRGKNRVWFGGKAVCIENADSHSGYSTDIQPVPKDTGIRCIFFCLGLQGVHVRPLWAPQALYSCSLALATLIPPVLPRPHLQPVPCSAHSSCIHCSLCLTRFPLLLVSLSPARPQGLHPGPHRLDQSLLYVVREACTPPFPTPFAEFIRLLS